jgi:hypothetical protein
VASPNELPLTDLGRIIVSFERQATDVVTVRGGRLVKLVGDAVMSPDLVGPPWRPLTPEDVRLGTSTAPSGRIARGAASSASDMPAIETSARCSSAVGGLNGTSSPLDWK